ncbi:membrane protein [Vulcanimicrobium alpinum]|uniref:Membrane protein n=2 Tax=Vulcanimicrobium alpinum TaxID=3016050 RepID=A0AAN1XVY0_UNVUL|nr:membrane protein [Vulcanimicrobium alpinum]
MRPDAPREADRPIGELLRELGDEIATLVRAEIALARAEMAEKAKPAVASAGMFGGSALLALGAFGAFTTFLIAVLALALQVWAAALIVTVIYGVIAFAFAQSGKHKLEEATPLVPEQTAQTVKEDIEWAKTRAQSGMRSR